MISSSTKPVDVSLTSLLLAVLNRWKLVGGVFFGIVLAGVAFLLLRSRSFVAEASFVPETRSEFNMPSALAALGGQLGLRLGSMTGPSPDFYASLLHSRELGYRLLDASVKPRRAEDSIRLVQFLRVRGKSRADSLIRGVRRLRRVLRVSVDRRTSVVLIRVELKDPEVAADVANTALREVNTFNLEQRRGQARERRAFTEARVSEASDELARAERELEGFYRKNRVWRDAPGLEFEEGRLQRRVQEAQELYLGLKREYEAARIQEINDTPVITVVDTAVVPTQRRRMLRPVPMAMLLFFAGGVALVVGLAAEGMHLARTVGNPEILELERRLRRLRRRVREPEPESVEVGD